MTLSFLVSFCRRSSNAAAASCCRGRTSCRVFLSRFHQKDQDRKARRCFTSSSTQPHPKTGGGYGYGNVRDRIIPSSSRKIPSLYPHCKPPNTCTILGAPMTYGQPFVGTDTSPTLIREAGLRTMLSALGWRVEDVPDLNFDDHQQYHDNDNNVLHEDSDDAISFDESTAKNCRLVGRGAERLAAVVEEKVREGRFPLILGGDHSIGIGSLAGILRVRPETGVLWIDAHADLNTPQTTESGNMHGMPIGMLTKGVAPANNATIIPGFEWLYGTGCSPLLEPDSIVYVGLRDVDPAERDLIHSLGIVAYTMTDIDHYGIGRVMDMALQHLLSKSSSRPLHLSYDIDVIDPVLAPATGTAVRGGLTFREAHYVAEAAAFSGNLASAEVVELNPALSDDQGAKATVELGLQIITSLMGKSII